MPRLPKIGVHNNKDPSNNNGIVKGWERVQKIDLQ